jgi:hypothetical protein
MTKETKRNAFAGKKEIGKVELLVILNQINDELANRNLQATFHLYGGCAVMLTCYDARRSWDIDYLFLGIPIQEASDIIDSVVSKNEFSRSQFDHTMGPLLHGYFEKNETYEFDTLSHLSIRVCTPRQLLAMKLLSARLHEGYQDFEDAVNLCEMIGVKTKEAAYAVLYDYVKKENVLRAESVTKRPGSVDNFITEVIKEVGA